MKLQISTWKRLYLITYGEVIAIINIWLLPSPFLLSNRVAIKLFISTLGSVVGLLMAQSLLTGQRGNSIVGRRKITRYCIIFGIAVLILLLASMVLTSYEGYDRERVYIYYVILALSCSCGSAFGLLLARIAKLI